MIRTWRTMGPVEAERYKVNQRDELTLASTRTRAPREIGRHARSRGGYRVQATDAHRHWARARSSRIGSGCHGWHKHHATGAANPRPNISRSAHRATDSPRA